MVETIFGISLLEFVYIIIYIFMAPFFIVGVWKLITWIGSMMKVRKGFLRVWKLLPNDQTIWFWARPMGGKITIKSKNPLGITDKSTININLGKGWVWRNGSIPFIKLDKDNGQIGWEQNRLGEDIPKEVIDEMADTSFAAGMMVGFRGKNEMRRIMMLVMVAIIVSVIGIGATYYLWSNLQIVTQVVNVVAPNTTSGMQVV